MINIPLEATFQYAFLFIIFSVFGILGETLFCYCWKIVYGERFWDYKIGKLFKGYSSWFNFIPWGIGGYLYIFLYEFIVHFQHPNYEYEFGLMGGVILFMLFLPFIIAFFRKMKPIKNVAKATTILFLPLLFVFLIHPVLALFLVAGSIILSFLEYLYGKILYWLFGKKFWVYNILPRDNGHISLIAPFGFAVAGLWFLTIYQIFLVLV